MNCYVTHSCVHCFVVCKFPVRTAFQALLLSPKKKSESDGKSFYEALSGVPALTQEETKTQDGFEVASSAKKASGVRRSLGGAFSDEFLSELFLFGQFF